ncbi:MAG: Uma2 family endonuclease [Firmicutes bacterium]|nr:Uma2 family endonuclease [Bacillota bacterium]
MKRIKRQRGYTNEQICEGTELPLGTVRKIFSGETKHPRYETMQALEKFFSDPHAANYPGPIYDFYPGQPPVLVKERNTAEDYIAYTGGTFNAGDLDRLRGDDGRGELIDGVIFNMASPSVAHQLIQTQLATRLQSFVDNNSGDCLTLTCPLDVYIEKNETTILQPDVVVICDRDLFRDGKVWGAPDLVIEILSPSTKERDLGAKYLKYMGFGVREYWIVDPMKERIIVYDFAHDHLIRIYTFRDKVPVAIWDGDLEIDFTPIAQAVKSIS